jgi:hypothetical protein
MRGAVTAFTRPLAIASLPLSRQGAGHEGEITLLELLLLWAGVVVRGGFVNAGILQHDLALGHAPVKKGHHFHCLGVGCEDGGVVAHILCKTMEKISRRAISACLAHMRGGDELEASASFRYR